MDDNARIDILLKEYETLRTEIISRTQSRFAITSIAAGAVALAFSAGSTLGSPWLFLILTSLAAALLWARLGGLIRRASEGLHRVEEKVNEIAGEELLVWEHRAREPWWRLFSG